MGDKPYSPHSGAASAGPSWRRPALATAILVVGVPLFISAGFWQLARAEEKSALLAELDAAVHQPVSTDLRPDTSLRDHRYRRFRVSGRYDNEHQVLLDNMTDRGANGYQVLTPLRMDGWTVLVNRGWVPADADRRRLPEIAVAENSRTLVGRLSHLPAPGLRLAGGESASGRWPRRMLFPERAELETALGTDLPEFQLLLEADQDAGYRRDWQVVAPDSGPAKHRGYALQWFSFAALTVIFYGLLMRGWLRNRRNPHVLPNAT